MNNCLFCKIIKGEIPAEIVYQDETVLAFKDIHSLAPVHILVIPKKHFSSVNDLTGTPESERIAGRLILSAKRIAVELGIAADGYKLLLRVGNNGGQEVEHIHLHLIGGAPLFEEIRPLN